MAGMLILKFGSLKYLFPNLIACSSSGFIILFSGNVMLVRARSSSGIRVRFPNNGYASAS